MHVEKFDCEYTKVLGGRKVHRLYISNKNRVIFAFYIHGREWTQDQTKIIIWEDKWLFINLNPIIYFD